MNRTWSSAAPGRAGVGTLVLVAILVTVAAVVQLYQHGFTSQVTDQASHSVLGRAAREIAMAAVQETRGLICVRLAKPGTPEFAAARNLAASRVGSPERFIIPVAELPVTTALIGATYSGIYQLEAVEAALDLRAALDGVVGDREGVLTITASVKSTLETGVERKVSRSWAYKTIAVAPIGDLKNVVGMIRAPDQVLKGRYDAREEARRCVEKYLPDLIADNNRALVDTRKALSEATEKELKDALNQLIGLYSPLTEGAGGGVFGQILDAVKARFAGLPALPSTPGDCILVHRVGDPAPATDDMSPAEFDLQGDLDESVPKLTIFKDELLAMVPQIKAAKTLDAATQALYRKYVDKLTEFARTCGKIAERYIHFREIFKVVAKGSAGFDGIADAWFRLDPVTRVPGFPNVPAFDPRMCVVLDAANPELPPTSTGINRLLGRLGRGAGFQGTILVDNVGQPLRLTGTFKGRWTLVVMGSLTLDDIRRSSAAQDLFTIVHAAADTESLTINGNVEATVVATGKRMSFRRNARVTGGLLVEDMDPASVVEAALTDPDRIVPDPLRLSADDRLRHVLVSPWSRSMESARDF